jgi:hypothetical protein
MKAIRIAIGDTVLNAELNASQTALNVWDVLPVTTGFNFWGDEIYCSIPLEAGPENSQAVVEVGDLGYWPPGHAFCIFYGPTPASGEGEIRPASPVNPIGRVLGDVKVLRQIAKKEDQIKIEKMFVGQ